MLVFGIYGATTDELTNVRVEDITMQGDVFLVKIPKTKTYFPRAFTIEGEYANIVKCYIALRPAKTDSSRFFVNYQNGKCVNQVIGRNKILGTPKKIATYLGLEKPEEYTSHSLRRTSASLASDGGASMTALKQHGGWLSDGMVERYIANSVETKRKMGNIITKRIQSKMTSTVVSQSDVVQTDSMATSSTAVNVQDNPQSDPMLMDVEPQSSLLHHNITTIATVTPPGHSVAHEAIVKCNPDRDIGKYVMNFTDCDVQINYK